MNQVTCDPPALSATRSFDDLPGPAGIPWFGNALQIDSARSHRQFARWATEYGPIYRLTLPGRKLVVVADHEKVASILRDRPDGFRRSTRLAEIWDEAGLPVGLFGANGDEWRHQRRMVMAAFDPAHVKHYFPSLQAVAARLARRWEKAAASDTAIDLQADLMRFTVDTIAGLAFGVEVDTLGSDQDVIQKHLDKIFPTVFKRVLAAADRPDSGIDDRQVAGNVLTMLLAGEDTTANTISWMIHLLWRNPAQLARATEEVRRVCGNGEAPDLAQLARLDYLDACANETMRLKPVAPINPQQTLRETTIGDVRIPAGIVVITLLGHDAIDERFVPQAATFKPERWLSEAGAATEVQSASPTQSAKRVSMPFGAGPRICPGRYLALLEMKIAMATLLGRFDIIGVDTPNGGEAQERLAFTMSPVGLSMRLKAR